VILDGPGRSLSCAIASARTLHGSCRQSASGGACDRRGPMCRGTDSACSDSVRGEARSVSGLVQNRARGVGTQRWRGLFSRSSRARRPRYALRCADKAMINARAPARPPRFEGSALSPNSKDKGRPGADGPSIPRWCACSGCGRGQAAPPRVPFADAVSALVNLGYTSRKPWARSRQAVFVRAGKAADGRRG